MDKIIVKNGLSHKCPNCSDTIGISNDKEFLFLNVAMIHIIKKDGKTFHKIKCKQCKKFFEVDEVEMFK